MSDTGLTRTLMANSVYPVHDTIRPPPSLGLWKPSGLHQLCIWLLGKSQLLPWKPTGIHHWEQMKFPPLSLKGARRRNSQHSARLAMHVRAKGNNQKHFFIMTLNVMPSQRVMRRCFSIFNSIQGYQDAVKSRSNFSISPYESFWFSLFPWNIC